jgi:hypothetical protein
MNRISRFNISVLLLMALSIGLGTEVAWAGNLSGYAWGENVGWINFNPSQGPGVTVTDAAVTGYAWGENIGWINLGPTTGGVVNDGEGHLSGFAWGENIGWINFAPTGGGVTIDPVTGNFSGLAWGENIGWISFASTGPVTYGVTTSWQGTADTDHDGIFNEVDTLPNTYSDDFSDVSIGGTTTGTITSRGDQTLTIKEEPNPSGVRIKDLSSVGPSPAALKVCGGAARLSLDAGDEAIVTCGSVTVSVISGVVEITFLGNDGTRITVSLAAGNSLTFDPVNLTITAPSSNSGPVVVLINGKQLILNPGQTGQVVPIDIKPDSFPNSINLGSKGTIPVAIISTATFDATMVNPTTVTLAGAPVKLKVNGKPMVSFQDVNSDGRLDLLLHVSTPALQLTSTDTEAILAGQTFGGTLIQGADSIVVKGHNQ